MPVLTEEKRPGGNIVPPRWPDEFDGGDGRGDFGSGFPLSKVQVAMWLLLTAVVMLFAGLSSAYLVLRGVPTWQSIAVPHLAWLNTLVLVISSGTLEIARHAMGRRNRNAVAAWIGASAVLGLLFLAGQIMVWRELVAAG